MNEKTKLNKSSEKYPSSCKKKKKHYKNEHIKNNFNHYYRKPIFTHVFFCDQYIYNICRYKYFRARTQSAMFHKSV